MNFAALNFKAIVPVACTVVALAIIFLIGHRHWFEHTTPAYQPPAVTRPTQPVKPGKPVKPAARPAVSEPQPVERPQVVPAPRYGQWTRTCDARGWCWTHYPWEP